MAKSYRDMPTPGHVSTLSFKGLTSSLLYSQPSLSSTKIISKLNFFHWHKHNKIWDNVDGRCMSYVESRKIRLFKLVHKGLNFFNFLSFQLDLTWQYFHRTHCLPFATCLLSVRAMSHIYASSQSEYELLHFLNNAHCSLYLLSKVECNFDYKQIGIHHCA